MRSGSPLLAAVAALPRGSVGVGVTVTILPSVHKMDADHSAIRTPGRMIGAPSTGGEGGWWGSGAHETSRASRSSMLSRRTITRAAPSRTATTGGLGVWLYWLDSARQ